MQKSQVIKAEKIPKVNISDIRLSKHKVDKKVKIDLKSKNIVFQTPFLKIAEPPRISANGKVCEIQTLFDGKNKSKIERWYQFIENVEQHITDKLIQVGSKWFESNNITIKSLIREYQDNQYVVKWIVLLKANMFVDENMKPIYLESIDSNFMVRLVVELPNIWINGDDCGLSAIVHKVMFKSHPEEEERECEYEFTDSESNSNSDFSEENLEQYMATEKNTGKSRIQNKFNIAPKLDDDDIFGYTSDTKGNLIDLSSQESEELALDNLI